MEYLKKQKNENETQLPENIAIDREIAELNNASKSELDKIDEVLKTSNKKQELVPHHNIKNTSYNHVYIVTGLIMALIGVSDALLSQRVYGIIFIGIGIVLFVIGIIKNKKYTATEKKEKQLEKNF